MELTVTIPGVPPSVNKGRSQHWSKVHAGTAAFRALARTATLRAVEDSDVDIVPWMETELRVVIWHYPDTLRGDTHNREKAVIDGLVDGLNAASEQSVAGQRSRKVFNDSRIAICSMHPERDKLNPRVVCLIGPEEEFTFGAQASGAG